ncbi:MAG: DNA repair protein RecN [Chitinivibrionales bacterium]|nr:DNA repair protein RecN [Chitinivibrionales bacterium]
MIRQLIIKNLALIDDLSISFHPGFSVFTGETGAGKSILIGAISLVLGERASAESVRRGSQECEITGIFELERHIGEITRILEQASIAVEENCLIIRRIISKNEKNRIFINQIPVPLTTLKTIGSLLIDFHGQHEHQTLLMPHMPNELVNSLPEVEPLWNRYSESFAAYTKAQAELARFDTEADKLAAQRDFLEYQHLELCQFNLKADEEAGLEEEYRMLSSSAERLGCIQSILTILEGSDDREPLEKQFAAIRKELELLSKFDPAATPWSRDLEHVETILSELSHFCGAYIEKNSEMPSQSRLEQINDRLAKLQRLKKKYHATIEELLARQADLARQLEQFSNLLFDRGALEKKVQTAKENATLLGQKLSAARTTALTAFDTAICAEMKKLGFTGGQWKTLLQPQNTLCANGLEQCSFEVRTNAGEPFMPLVKTASGGELSRLMLAIKTIQSRHDDTETMIFDEIDTGIGGLTAKEVATALCNLSSGRQVICISHLHQIASLAEHHYKVFKLLKDDRTIVNVHYLLPEEKIAEISRMLGSDSAVSKKHAEELLTQTRGNEMRPKK